MHRERFALRIISVADLERTPRLRREAYRPKTELETSFWNPTVWRLRGQARRPPGRLSAV